MNQATSIIPDSLTHGSCVVNRTLITSYANRRISRMSPSQYVQQLVPDERRRELMESHFITPDALDAMHADDFEAFLLHREQALVEEIRRQLTV